MKKSISTISLKRKNSEGFNTNRTSLNQSQFVNHKLERKFITKSMDSEVFRQFMPSYQNLGFTSKSNQYRPF